MSHEVLQAVEKRPSHLRLGRLDRDGQWLAYTRGHDLYTRDMQREGENECWRTLRKPRSHMPPRVFMQPCRSLSARLYRHTSAKAVGSIARCVL